MRNLNIIPSSKKRLRIIKLGFCHPTAFDNNSRKAFEKSYPDLSTEILEGREPNVFGDNPLTPQVSELEAARAMSRMIDRLCHINNMPCPEDLSDAFCQGAITAFMNIYNKLKPQKT